MYYVANLLHWMALKHHDPTLHLSWPQNLISSRTRTYKQTNKTQTQNDTIPPIPYPIPFDPLLGFISKRNKTKQNETKTPLVISDELIREVETRMNRNYLPPALKLHCSNNAGQHSPPTVAPCPANTNPSTILTARRTFGSRTKCKLPTVQEQVGKFGHTDRPSSFLFFSFFPIIFHFLLFFLFIEFLLLYFYFLRNHKIHAGWYCSWLLRANSK